MVALELARARPGELAALVLVATTPCFLAREDWPAGMNPGVLDGFAAGLAGDYRRTIANFLALQTWGDENATQALRSLRANLDSHGEPDPQALAAGLGILRHADLRDELASIAIPTLVIAGEARREAVEHAGIHAGRPVFARQETRSGCHQHQRGQVTWSRAREFQRHHAAQRPPQHRCTPRHVR
jgi:pimeloyl-[acyl-carrier protein] methyl ester esterase